MEIITLQLIWQIPLLLMSVVVWFAFLDGFFSPFPSDAGERQRLLDLVRKKETGVAEELARHSQDPLVKLGTELVEFLKSGEGDQERSQELERFYGLKRQAHIERHGALFGDIQQCSVVVGFLGTLLGSYEVLRDISHAGSGVGFGDLFGGLSGAITSSIYGVLLFLGCVLAGKILEGPSRRTWGVAQDYLRQVETAWRAVP